jgi:hypothetical protein
MGFVSRRQVDGVYYITHVLIPPLERVFNLVGADVRGWYNEMPRSFRVEQEDAVNQTPGKQEIVDDEGLRIIDHFRNCRCLVCRSMATEGETSNRWQYGVTHNSLDAKRCVCVASATHTRLSYLYRTG